MEQLLARRSFCLANVILFFGFCTLVLAGCIGVTASTLLHVAVAHVVSLSFTPRCLQKNRIGVSASLLLYLAAAHVVPLSFAACKSHFGMAAPKLCR